MTIPCSAKKHQGKQATSKANPPKLGGTLQESFWLYRARLFSSTQRYWGRQADHKKKTQLFLETQTESFFVPEGPSLFAPIQKLVSGGTRLYPGVMELSHDFVFRVSKEPFYKMYWNWSTFLLICREKSSKSLSDNKNILKSKTGIRILGKLVAFRETGYILNNQLNCEIVSWVKESYTFLCPYKYEEINTGGTGWVRGRRRQ